MTGAVVYWTGGAAAAVKFTGGVGASPRRIAVSAAGGRCVLQLYEL